MRTFVAIPLPDPCRRALLSTQDELQSCRADVRWTAATSIHLTLKFLGEVDPEKLDPLCRALRECCRVPSFTLKLAGLGCFPNPRHPKVLWCGLEGDTETLRDLQGRVDSACVSLGFTSEDRPYHPHLTLGRVRGRKNLELLIEMLPRVSPPPCSFEADQFHVYRSKLTPRGALYDVLSTVRMAGND